MTEVADKRRFAAGSLAGIAAETGRAAEIGRTERENLCERLIND
jgi:hypothetical protein